MYFLFLWISLFCVFHSNAVIQFVNICAWLFSPEVISVVPCISTSIFMIELYSIVQMDHIFFMHLHLVDIWVVSTFWWLWITLLWLLWAVVYKFCWNICFQFWGYVHRSWIVKSYANSVFNLLTNLQIQWFFSSVCSNLLFI